MKASTGSGEYEHVVLADPRTFWTCAVMVAMAGAARADIRGDALDAEWTRALDAISTALASRDDVDRTIEIVVVPADGGVRVIARRTSGATAERSVDRLEDLGPTILALLVMPMLTVVPDPAPIAVDDAEPVPKLDTPVDATRDLRLHVGVSVGARWQGTVGVGGHAFGELVARGWLVGASVGWTRVDTDLPDAGSAHFNVKTVEVGVDVGRRLALGPLDLAAYVGPRVASSTTSLDEVRASPSGLMMFNNVRDVVTTRFGGGVRMNWAASKRVQLLLRLDAGVDLTTADGSSLEVRDPTFTTMEPPHRAFGVALMFGGAFGVAP